MIGEATIWKVFIEMCKAANEADEASVSIDDLVNHAKEETIHLELKDDMALLVPKDARVSVEAIETKKVASHMRPIFIFHLSTSLISKSMKLSKRSLMV